MYLDRAIARNGNHRLGGGGLSCLAKEVNEFPAEGVLLDAVSLGKIHPPHDLVVLGIGIGGQRGILGLHGEVGVLGHVGIIRVEQGVVDEVVLSHGDSFRM